MSCCNALVPLMSTVVTRKRSPVFGASLNAQGGYFSPANLELSYSLMELRRNDDAIAALLLVAEKDAARYPITYYHLGRLYELRGDLQLAEEHYLRATQAHQVENAQFLLNLSGVREKRGDFAGALVAMENYIKRKEQRVKNLRGPTRASRACEKKLRPKLSSNRQQYATAKSQSRQDAKQSKQLRSLNIASADLTS